MGDGQNWGYLDTWEQDINHLIRMNKEWYKTKLRSFLMVTNL